MQSSLPSSRQPRQPTRKLSPPTRLLQTKFFTNWFSQIRETKNRAYGLPREDHYTPEYVPNGVRWKNLLRRHLLSPAACRNLSLNSFPDFRILELAKGFEPLTL